MLVIKAKLSSVEQPAVYVDYIRARYGLDIKIDSVDNFVDGTTDIVCFGDDANDDKYAPVREKMHPDGLLDCTTMQGFALISMMAGYLLGRDLMTVIYPNDLESFRYSVMRV
jgi:hypothetical protein